MSPIKENEIYPKFEFRLSHKEKAWLTAELKELKMKFGTQKYPVTKHTLMIAALRLGLRSLKGHKKLSSRKRG